MISIIIVNYNNSKFLDNLFFHLTEIINDKSYEIIFIDDCSNDNSINIVDNNTKNSSNFFLFKNSINMGLVSSWKIGLIKSKGEFITFLDSDDYIDSRLFKTSMNQIFKDSEISTDVFIFNHFQDSVKQEYINHDEDLNKADIKDKDLYSKKTTFGNKISFTRWAKLYKKSFILKYIDFIDNKLTIGEDVVTNFLLFSMANKIHLSKDTFYNYNTLNLNSLMRKKYHDYIDKIKLVIDNLSIIKNYLLKVNDFSLQLNTYVDLLILNYLYYFTFKIFKPLIIFKNLKELKQFSRRLINNPIGFRSRLIKFIYNAIN